MKYILLSFTLALFACNSNPQTSETETEEKLTMDSTESRPSEMPGKTIILEGGSDCIRSVAQSIVKKGVYPTTTFVLQPNNATGIETIIFDNGDKLIIKNWGCDYTALTFRFETGRFQEDLSNIGFWYKRAVTLLNEVNKNLVAPLDVIQGTERLVTQIEDDVANGYQNLKLNEELNVGEDTTENFVRIDKVEKLDEKKYALEITFAKGPLKR